jgi:hypothetical protein
MGIAMSSGRRLGAGRESTTCYQECTQTERDQIARREPPCLSDGQRLDCYKGIWLAEFKRDDYDAIADLPDEETVLKFANGGLRCPRFFSYEHGNSPMEHKKLQQDQRDRRVKLIVAGFTLLASLIGAAVLVARYAFGL